MTLRIGLITDIHSGPDMDTRLGTQAFVLLDQFVEEMTQRFKPDLIVDLGDRINDAEAAGDRQRIRKVRSRLETVGVPVLYLYGNHDLVNIGPIEQRRLLGKQADHESLDFRGVHLILLNSQDPTVGRIGGTLSDQQLRWLEQDLRLARGPVVVFCHHPLDEQDFRSHWYFGKHPEHALAVNRERARGIFNRSGRVRAVVSGHMHWNQAQVIDKIPYITVQSLVDCSLTDGKPAGSYSEVTVEQNGHVGVEVRGRLPMSFRYP